MAASLATARWPRISRLLRLFRLGVRRAVGYLGMRGRQLRHPEQADEAQQRYLIRSAEDVARELGQMKGVAMKAGQLMSFLFDGLPEPARAALASLQAGVPPMDPDLARRVIRQELGRDPHRLFDDWSDWPVAAASIGQVHRAVLRDGRIVAVKIQYPGIARTLQGDLDNAELLYGAVRMFALPNLDARALVDELRDRMSGELDYVAEARWQAWFAEFYAGHPFIHVPRVVSELCTSQVLTSEWVDGWTWDELVASAGEALQQRVAEVMFRFVQGSIYRCGAMHGDPHPGNYRFHPDGRVSFLDFGLVKEWGPGELESLLPLIGPLFARDAAATVAAMVDAGFLPVDHGLDPDAVFAYVSQPYLPYLEEPYRFEPGFASRALAGLLDLDGPHRPVMVKVDMPPSFVVLDRVVWGMSALLGRLHAENRWRSILDEYRLGGPPATALGVVEDRWWRTRRGGALSPPATSP